MIQWTLDQVGQPDNSKVHLPLTTSRGAGTIPEPAEVLRGPRNGRTFLPPRSRSPIKTNLGSSPRRSMGAVSSPSRFYDQTPTRATSHPLNETILDMSREELTPSVEASELEGRSSQLKGVKKAKLNGRGVKRPFNLSLDDDDDDDDDETAPSAPAFSMAPPVLSVGFDESQTSTPPVRLKPGRGRPPKVPKPASIVIDVVESVIEQPEATEEALPVLIEDEAVAVEPEVEQEAGQEADEDEQPIVADEDDGGLEQESEEAQGMIKKRRGRKPALSRKDSNTKMKPPPRPKGNAAQGNHKTASNQNDKTVPRSLYVSRSETPAQDAGAQTTRAGRNVLKPVAFWRGERIVYGDGSLDGSNLTLPGIKEVIRTEEVVDPRPKKGGYRRHKPTSRKEGGQEEDEEDEDEREPWETETGIVRAQVLQWDSITGRYDEENTEEAGKFMQAVLLRIP